MGRQIIEKDHIMGGTFLVQTWVDDKNSIDEISTKIRDGFNLVHQLEDKLTDFRESPFNRINMMAGQDWVQVDQETYDLIKKSLEISRQTKGAFDISYASIGHLWRDARSKGELPEEEEIKKRLPYVNFDLIKFRDKTCEVYLPHKLMRIGLGGIGKGYAVDRLYQYLQNFGVKSFLVSGAGDIRVKSSLNAPRPWRLAIKNPFTTQSNVAGFIEIRNGSMATSGDYINYVKNQEEESKMHHILEAKTGMPAVDIASCTVIAHDTITADTMATTVMAMKSENGIKYLNNQDFFGVLIKTDGQVLLSRKAMSHFGTLSKNKKVTV